MTDDKNLKELAEVILKYMIDNKIETSWICAFFSSMLVVNCEVYGYPQEFFYDMCDELKKNFKNIRDEREKNDPVQTQKSVRSVHKFGVNRSTKQQ